MDIKVISTNTTSSKRLLVKQAVTGATSLNQELGLFDFGNVIVQRNYAKCEKVRIVSGGANYMGDLVGKGMLTAAIQGDNLAAPASNIILRTLQELGVKHIMGTVIIIPGDTGSILNFGLAIERSVDDLLKLRQVVIADDYTNNLQPKILRQALGGIILLYKIAGAMSEADKSLTQIYSYCDQCCLNLKSMKLEFPLPVINPESSCICITSNEMEDRGNVLTSIKTHLDNLINVQDGDSFNIDWKNNDNDEKLLLQCGDNVVMLINNNLVLNKTDAYLYVKDIIEYLTHLGINVARFYVGDFMKILESGLSITLMKVVDEKVLHYLDAPCTAPGWKKVNQGLYGPLTTECIITAKIQKTARQVHPIKGPMLSERATNILLFAMQFACSALISCEEQINIIDSTIAKGNIGTRMKITADRVLKRLKDKKIVLEYPYTFFDNMSKLLEKTLGGKIGSIYSILFEAAANVFGNYIDAGVTAIMWMEAFEAATEALKGLYGNINFEDGTMYDPLYMFCKLAKIELQEGGDELMAFGKGVAKAEEVIEATKKNRNYPDPGAHIVGIWMRAIYEGVKVRWPN